MKRTEYPANTLTGPRWLLGNKAKWLLSDSLSQHCCAAPVALSSASSPAEKPPTVQPSPGISPNYTLLMLLEIIYCMALKLASRAGLDISEEKSLEREKTSSSEVCYYSRFVCLFYCFAVTASI